MSSALVLSSAAGHPIATALLDIPPTCQRSNSVTCAAVYDWTHNDYLAHLAAWAIGKPLSILALLVLAFFLRWLIHRVIDRVVERAAVGIAPARLLSFRKGSAEAAAAVERTPGRRVQRARSLGSLLRSISSGVIFGVILVMILAQVGINIAPILASAGVLGLAIGFGAQSLVKDFLAGIAMMVEDQYGVGDVVTLGTTSPVSGTVESVGLRVTRIRDVTGTVWYVPNGQILQVGNSSQEWARTVLDIVVGYDEDVQRVKRILNEVSHDFRREAEFKRKVLEDPEVWGVESMTAEGVTIRVVLKTRPLEQWTVARALRERIKQRFDSEGIEQPYPQKVIWHRNSSAPQPGKEDK